MTDTRPTVLILLGCFRRGNEATGPNQSLIGMAKHLSDRFRFRVIAEATAEDEPGRWTRLEGIEQLPLTPTRLGARGLRGAIATTPHDLLVTNSLFDRVFTIPMLAMRRFGALPRKPVLLAPRGELSPGALGLSNGRKSAYLGAAKAAGLLRDVEFQATGSEEAKDIHTALGDGVPVHVTPNIRSLPALPAHSPRAPGQPLRVVFLSRIDRKKNLEYALDTLLAADRPAQFSLFGPISNEGYWRGLQRKIATMPRHVEVIYRGAIPQRDVLQTMATQDLFFLPTLGENFGHAIADALTAGTPALLSDLTPWRGLAQANAGWDIPLSNRDAFAEAVRKMADVAPDDCRAMRRGAREFVEQALDPIGAADQLAQCIEQLIGRHARADLRNTASAR